MRAIKVSPARFLKEPASCPNRHANLPSGGNRTAQQTLGERIEAEMEKALEDAHTGGGVLDTAGPAAEGSATTPFQWLHIHVLREYLEKEFAPPASGVDFGCVAGGWSLERLIDDFIFLCFFVGNDFLPHLPSLDIRSGAIDTLCDLYKSLLPKMGGWICDGGTVHLERVLTFCTELGGYEDELLLRTRAGDERQKDKAKRRSAELQSKTLGRRHAALMRRVAEYAVSPQVKVLPRRARVSAREALTRRRRACVVSSRISTGLNNERQPSYPPCTSSGHASHLLPRP